MNLQEFTSREGASLAAAGKIVASLERRLGGQTPTNLVVTGGSSPVQCYAQLAKADIAWRNVRLVLSDERWVPPDHPDSNEKLVRDTLLTGHAAQAGLLPFYDAAMSITERSEDFSREYAGFDTAACALLGMGDDGHFASLFPDAENLQVGLRPGSSIFCIPVNTTSSPYPRISLTLSALLKSDELVLLCFGDAKRDVLDKASRGEGNFPIAHLLRQSHVPATIFWAP